MAGLEPFRDDADHFSRRTDLVARLITNEDLRRRTLEVAEIAVKTRWACMNDILGEVDPLLAEVSA